MRFTLLLILFAHAPPANAQVSPRDLATLLSHEAVVDAPASGLVRVPLRAEALRVAQPTLADVRVFSAAGIELPYFVDSGPSRTRTVQSVVAQATHVEQSSETTTGATTWHETYRLPTTGLDKRKRWALVIESSQPHFVRQVTVSAPQTYTTPIGESSIFRLQNPRRERTQVPLPGIAGGYLQVNLHGEGAGYLDPVFRFEGHDRLPTQSPWELEIPLVESDRERHRTQLRLSFARPTDIVPNRLRIYTSATAFHREVSVFSVGPGGRRHLASETVYRLAQLPHAEMVEIKLPTHRGQHLAVDIEDGDAPPLPGLRFGAVVSRPALVFEAQGRATILLGGGRAHRPRYGFEALLNRVVARPEFDGQVLTLSHGEVRNNPAFDRTPALAFLMHPGTAVDTRGFHYTAALPIPQAPEGLIRILLTPQLLAAAQPDLADIRVVDQGKSQWAYLIEHGADHQWVPMVVTPHSREDGARWSSYTLEATPGAVTPTAWSIRSLSTYFDRRYEIRAHVEAAASQDQASTRLVSQGRLVRRPDQPESYAPITVPTQRAHVQRYTLRIEDGLDPPLAELEVRARVELAALYLAAPEGAYEVLVGNPNAEPAHYDIERARELVLAVAPVNAPMNALQPNPAYVPARHVTAWDEIILWCVLVLAVLLLVFLTFRVARQVPAESEPT